MPPIPGKEPTPPKGSDTLPDVRLAYNPGPVDTYRSIKKEDSPKPDVRLATTIHRGAMSPEQFERALNKKEELDPTVRLAVGSNQLGQEDGFIDKAIGREGSSPVSPQVRLAHGPGAQGDNVLIGQRGVAAMPGRAGGDSSDDSLPALLVSYYYLPQFMENRHRYHYRDWVIDSGAYSAHNSGAEIKLQEYIDCCKKLIEEDPSLVEVYALDVIGDWKGSLKNTEEMWAQGVPAIPCYHANEPWDVLIGMARDYPKIALGGVALAKSGQKMSWAAQCFSRVWPKKIHGFAFGSEKAIMTLPFHSVDATSWEVGPCKYGQWKAFGNQRVSVRGSQQNLRAEVEWYLELEKKARLRWKKEMALLESVAPTVRLAMSTIKAGICQEGKAVDKALASPDVRLAMAGAGSDTYYKEGGIISNVLGPPSVRLVSANDAGQGGARVLARALGDETSESEGQQLIRGPVVRLAESGEGGRIDAKVAAFTPPKK